MHETHQACSEAIEAFLVTLRDPHPLPAEAWRRSGIHRAISALLRAEAIADKGALLREAVRLSSNALTLPEIGLASSDLSRFGLAGVPQAGRPGWTTWMLVDEDQVPAGWPRDLPRAVDPHLRKIVRSEPPDGALLRLSPYRSYQTASQKAAIRALLTMPPGGTLLATMPTGSGKSLMFQLGVRWWREQERAELPCAVVIVPTVALALDHLESVRKIPGLEGCEALVGGIGTSERERILQAFRCGEVPLLFLSPEAAMQSAREALLESAKPRSERPSAAKGRLWGVFIDEAHIIETWGRSFRPDFQRLRGLVSRLRLVHPELRTVLLSATVGEGSHRILRQAYGTGSFLEVAARVPRYELDLVVHHCESEAERDALVVAMADRLPRPALIYTTQPEHAERLYLSLRDRGFRRLALFTGDTEGAARRAVIEGWRNDQLDLVVATSAFGMGVDKPNVRAVVHATLPEDASRYYQEIGRASRDGYQGLALCLWTSGDPKAAMRAALGQDLTVEVAILHWRAILRDAQERDGKRFDSETGQFALRFSLNAAHGGLGRKTGRHNRRWNLSLLNVLQRAGYLEVQLIEDEADMATVFVSDPRLLDDGEENLSFWESVFAFRDKEQDEVRKAVGAYLSRMTSPGDLCLQAMLYELVEADCPLVPPCGRCPVCRQEGEPPPTTVESHGLDQVWAEGMGRGGIGRRLIHPDTPDRPDHPRLIGRLQRSGIEQFVVPDGYGEAIAIQLSEMPSHCGLVLESRHVLDGWGLANLPSALLLFPQPNQHADTTRLVEKVRARFESWPGQTLVVVAPEDLRIQGKPFAQIAGNLAPYPELSLDWPPTGEFQ